MAGVHFRKRTEPEMDEDLYANAADMCDSVGRWSRDAVHTGPGAHTFNDILNVTECHAEG